MRPVRLPVAAGARRVLPIGLAAPHARLCTGAGQRSDRPGYYRAQLKGVERGCQRPGRYGQPYPDHTDRKIQGRACRHQQYSRQPLEKRPARSKKYMNLSSSRKVISYAPHEVARRQKSHTATWVKIVACKARCRCCFKAVAFRPDPS